MPKEDEQHLGLERSLEKLSESVAPEVQPVQYNAFAHFVETLSDKDGEILDRELDEVFTRFEVWAGSDSQAKPTIVKSEEIDESGKLHSITVNTSGGLDNRDVEIKEYVDGILLQLIAQDGLFGIKMVRTQFFEHTTRIQ